MISEGIKGKSEIKENIGFSEDGRWKEGQSKISIIIATFNSSKVIGRCLKSIESQSYSEIEVIIVDGLSADSTEVIVKGFTNLKIKFISEKDSGVYDAWNKGLRASTSEWVTFIGSDDYYSTQDSIKLLMEVAVKETSIPFVYGKLVTRSEDGHKIGESGDVWRPYNGFRQNYVYAHFPFPIMSSVYHRDFISNRKFSINYKIVGDMDLMLSSLSRWEGKDPEFIDRVIVDMSVGGISTNMDNYVSNLKESYACRINNGLSVFNFGMTIRSIKILLSLFFSWMFGKKAYQGALSSYRFVRSAIRSLVMFGAK